MAYTLSKEKYGTSSRDFLTKLKLNSYKYCNDFNPKKVFSSNFKERDFKPLSEMFMFV